MDQDGQERDRREGAAGPPGGAEPAQPDRHGDPDREQEGVLALAAGIIERIGEPGER
jgi:hypothetical protein